MPAPLIGEIFTQIAEGISAWFRGLGFDGDDPERDGTGKDTKDNGIDYTCSVCGDVTTVHPDSTEAGVADMDVPGLGADDVICSSCLANMYEKELQ